MQIQLNMIGVKNPKSDHDKKLREKVSRLESCGITKAQDICANWIFTSRRTWQQWEVGDRKMHAGFWELANIKFKRINGANCPNNAPKNKED